MGTDATAAGVDRGIYPSAKSFLVGLDITFLTDKLRIYYENKDEYKKEW